MSEESITVAECAKRIGKSEAFIRRAIINGSFPGSYTLNENGVGNFHIPRKAFEEYMTHFYRSASDELIEALIESYMQSKQKAPAATGTK